MRAVRSITLICGIALTLTACQDQSPVAPRATSASHDVLTGWILTPRGEPLEVSYEVIAGRAIHEGDIDLGPAGTIPKTIDELLGRTKPSTGKMAPSDPVYGSVYGGSQAAFWTSGQIAYVISAGFTSSQQQTILDAMAYVQSATGGITFTPWTNQSSRVVFALNSAGICASPVARRGGAQTINLTAGCANNRGDVAHEILHSLGMWHEQSRCDRDNFISINWANIQPGMEYNFGKKCPFTDEGGIDKLSYDEGSIMHYPRFAFSSNGQPTISSLRGLDYVIDGSHQTLTQTDISTLNLVYQPYPVWINSVSYPGGTPAISWNASPTAISYGVNLVQFYEDYNAGTGQSTSYDATSFGVGTTTGLSMQDTDPEHVYTGCSVWFIDRGDGSWQSYTYYYEVLAQYPDGVVSRTSRWTAEVMACQ